MNLDLKKISIAALLLGIATLLFWLLNSQQIKSFHDFSQLQWDTQPGCKTTNEKAHAFSTISRTLTWGKNSHEEIINCASKWFVAKTNFLDIEYAGKNPNGGVSISIETPQETLGSYELPSYQRGGIWHKHTFPLPKTNEKIRLRITDKDSATAWVSVRNRVNFYQVEESTLIGQLRDFSQHNTSLVLIFFSFALFFWLRTIQPLFQTHPKTFFFCLWTAASAILFRPDLYFYMDEWHLLERFNEKGWASALLAHNEHFIPLFFWSYFVELKLFAGSYFAFVLCSSALLTSAAILLGKLASKLFACEKNIAAIIAIGFAISALHSESVQWIMVQGALFVLILRSLAMFSAINFFKTGKRKEIISACFYSFLAPLFFGAGLLIFTDLFLLSAFMLAEKRATLKETFKLLIPLSLPLVLVVALYATAPQSSATASSINSFSVISYLEYIGLGTLLGTLVRGIGAWPFSEFGEIGSYTTYWATTGSFLVATLLLTSTKKEPKRSFLIIAFGILLAATIFLLTGIGRASYGPTQALSFRYCSLALFGICFAITPLLCSISKFPTRTRNTLAFLFIASQVYLSTNYDYYWRQGALTRDFTNQTQNWNEKLGRTPFDKNISYEAKETTNKGNMPLAYGGYPKDPSAQTSILHPDAMTALTRKFLQAKD